LKALDLRFILGAKADDHTFPFEWVHTTQTTAEHTVTDEGGTHHRFRYLNGVPLNDANFDLEVNFFEYWETTPKGKVTHFSWVTDFPIDPTNLMTLMRGGRARWKIENETFNTLKNGLGHPSGQYLDRRVSSGAFHPKDSATYGWTFAVSGQGGRNDDQVLKNQGYHFEHNFGHGNQNLSTVLMHWQ